MSDTFSLTQTILPVDCTYSDSVDLGFDFRFYGTTYSKCVLGSNGNINFNLSNAGGFDPWVISGPLLSDTGVRNSICAPWTDLVPQVWYYYGHRGVAPNREFILVNCESAQYFCYWFHGVTSVVVLHETSNLIDVYVGQYNYCPEWNGGNAIIGVVNAAGTAATTAPGRDYPAQWNASREAWQFSPGAADTTYAVTSIPYDSLPYPTNLIYFCWYETISGINVGCGDSVTINPTEPALGYTVMALVCNDTFLTASVMVDTNGVVSGVPSYFATIPASISPNPAHDLVDVDHPDNSTITVFDMSGRVRMIRQSGGTHTLLDLGALPDGTYMIRITSPRATATIRVLKI
jgi:Secretion system C-terminal sorting domain